MVRPVRGQRETHHLHQKSVVMVLRCPAQGKRPIGDGNGSCQSRRSVQQMTVSGKIFL